MSNGEPFDEAKWYKVAVNSYRGNGGGESSRVVSVYRAMSLKSVSFGAAIATSATIS